jgi:hypothetical protein
MKTELALYQALIAINVSESKATAVIQALESDMTNLLATKADMAELRKDMHNLGTDLRKDLQTMRNDLLKDMDTFHAQIQTKFSQQDNKLLIRLGVMFSFAAGTIIAVLKYL